MAFTKTPSGRLLLLNPEGQRRLEAAYDRRARPRCSFADFADGYLQRLKDDGMLSHYLSTGVDPFDVLRTAAEFGVD